PNDTRNWSCNQILRWLPNLAYSVARPRYAITTQTHEEFGYTTNYEYHWGGTVDDNNVYTAGPGYHLIETLNRNVYRFDEETRTWEIIRQSE
ncbi:MAG: hypothetical protein AAF126_03970, partial [Chloroflexota bacterium]